MRVLLLALCSFGLLITSSCDGDTNRFDLSKEPLSGKIGGADWTYTGGNAKSPFGNQATGLILNQETTDPCTITSTVLAHVQITVPIAEQIINLPDPGNQAVVKLVTPNGGPVYTVTGGFIQIVEVTGREMIGYISGDYDDDNYVQGSFYVKFCD